MPQARFNDVYNMQNNNYCFSKKNKILLSTNLQNCYLMQCKNKNHTYIPNPAFNSSAIYFPKHQKIINPNLNFAAFNSKALRKANKSLNEKEKAKKSSKYGQKFTPDEDEKLKKLVETIGSQKWDLIAKEMPGRNGRQCRDRYKNYLMPGYFTGQWSKEEDLILRKKYYEYGPQWSKIADFLKNRSSNAVKNRWNYFVSKHLEEECDSMINNNEEQNAKQNGKINNQPKNEENRNYFEINPILDLFDNENDDENNDFNINDEYFEFAYLYEN